MKARAGERAQSTVEFALMLPVLVLMLLGAFDLGRGIWAYNVLSNAAREGARLGVIQSTAADENDAAIRDAVRGYVIGLEPIGDGAIIVSRGGAGAARTVTVLVNYEYGAVTPVIDRIFAGGKIPLKSSATMIIE